MALVQEFQKFPSRYISAFADFWRALQVRNRLFSIERGPLKYSRQERRVPMVRPDLRHSAGIGNGDKGWQILVLRSQRVTHPGAHAREAIDREPCAHLVFRRPMRVAPSRHRMDEAKVVSQPGQMRQQIRNHFPALPARPELPWAADEVPVLALERNELVHAWHAVAIALDQLRFVVPSVEVTKRT